MNGAARSGKDVRDALARLSPSSHLCVTYQHPAVQFAVAVPFVGIGLARREQCVYIQDDVTDSGPALLDALRADGVDAGAAVRAGALTIVRADAYLAQPRFDAEGMIGWMGERARAAHAEGYSGLRLVGEGSKSLAGHPDLRRFTEYETRLNPFLRDHQAAFLCQYDRRQFSPDIVREVIATHPLVMVGDLLCRNPYHVEAEAYLAADWREREIDWLLENLSRLQRFENALRASEERYRALSQRLLEVQEEDRRSIARNLHDQLGQTLTAARLALKLTGGGGAELAESRSLLDEAARQVHDLAFDLRPASLDLLGLPEALRAFLKREGKRAGLEVRLDVRGSLEERLPREVEIACFRMVQEALTNVVRHAAARRVDVELADGGPEARVAVRDDGQGFDVRAVRARAATRGGLGLVGMEERVALAGGQLEIASAPGSGTTIRARFPRAAARGT